MKRLIVTLFLLSSGLAGCMRTGGLSMYDEGLFKESPKIVFHDDHYYLRFRYSTDAFAFNTHSSIEHGRLIFSLPVTTSSGFPNGRVGYERIANPDKVALIQQGEVYWREPDDALVPLAVEPMSKDYVDDILYYYTHR